MPKRADRLPPPDPRPHLADVPQGCRFRIEGVIVSESPGLVGTRVRVGEWEGPLASQVPVELLAE